MSAERSASAVSRAEGVDPVRALQRVLYRSAKQDPKRRFHALYDKVARGDIMWRAWVDVATNGGAPGVDGVSIEAIEDGGVQGVRVFLDGLAAELRDKRYRPQPLRRVHIPKPGKPGQTRPLGIPVIRDRVIMAAAKIVLEQFSRPTSPRSVSGSARSVRLTWPWRPFGSRSTGDANGCSMLTSRRASTRHHTASCAAGASSKRLGSVGFTLIRRPFLRPARTWTASSECACLR